MSDTTVYVPGTLEELSAMLKQTDAHKRILAGGTDLLVSLRSGSSAPGAIIDLSGLDCLKSIVEEGPYIVIGAMVTFSQLERSPLIQRYASCLYEASRRIGSTQIRNMATLGGNIANAAPAADGAAALLALDAEVLVFHGPLGSEWIRLDRYLNDKLAHLLTPGHIIQSIRFKKEPEGYRSAFSKLGLRSSVTISQLILACVVYVDPDTRIIADGQIVLGALGPRSFVDEAATQWMIGRPVNEDLQATLTEKLRQSVQAAIPDRASMPYKRIAIAGLVDDIFNRLFDV